jgi:hypothetical protein
LGLVCALASLATVHARAAAHAALYKYPTLYSYDIDDSYDTLYSIEWIEDVLVSQSYSPVFSGRHSQGASSNFWAHYNGRIGDGYEVY